MWKQITEELIHRLKTDRNVKDLIGKFERSVYEGNMTSGEAAEKILKRFIADQENKYR
jgi:LAO/AO transport system kinase